MRPEELMSIKCHSTAMVVSCPGNGKPHPAWPIVLWPGSTEDVDKNREAMYTLWNSVTGCQSELSGPPGPCPGP